jgi:hypothetical protein
MIRFIVFTICIFAGIFSEANFAIYLAVMCILGCLMFWLPSIVTVSKNNPKETKSDVEHKPTIAPNDE